MQAWIERHRDEVLADWELAASGENPYKIAHFETNMYWDVKTVKPLSDFRVYVEVEDGQKGVFDLKPYLDHGVFRELKDVHYFNQVGILFGAVTWPHNQDIAPETLLAEMLPVESIVPDEPLQGAPGDRTLQRR